METTMKYTLITGKGKIMLFYIQGLAETYQNLYGGVIVTEAVMTEVEKEVA
jgi:hypothetical protein